MSAGYSGTPLPAKLGIKAGMRLLLLGAAGVPVIPELTPLPDAVVTHRRSGAGQYDIVLLFCPDLATLQRRFAPAAGVLTSAGALWACWPKKSSGVPTDLGDADVRRHGLRSGLVDIKVAAIDATWSGLKFVQRLADRS